MTTFQIVTDAHAGSKAVGHGSSRKLTDQAQTVLNDVLTAGQNRHQVDAILDLGDLIEQDSSQNPDLRANSDLQNFNASLRAFTDLDVPSLHCIGNHPVMAASEDLITKALGLELPYFSRVIGEHQVIMLHSRFQHKVNSENHQSGSGIHIDQQQLKWLKKELTSAEKPVLICCHHPISDQDLQGNFWFEKFPQCALMTNGVEVRQMLANSGKVVAVLNGHTHWNYLTQDEFGTPHITLQSLSENFRNDGTPAATYGIAVLKEASFNLEVFGNDLSLRNAVQSPTQIRTDLANTYDSIATTYDQKTSQFGEPEHRQFDALLSMLKPDHSGLVIDFGCGPGRDVPYYQSRGFRVIGVDASKRLLDIAQKRSPEAMFLNQDFAEASIAPNSAAIAIHNSSLQHVPRLHLEATLQRVYDSLEPGGIFYCHYRSGTGESLSISTEYGLPIARFIALYTESEMESCLEKIGFRIIKSETFDHKYTGLKGKVVQYKTRTWAHKP